jgi:hypothetical protein
VKEYGDFSWVNKSIKKNENEKCRMKNWASNTITAGEEFIELSAFLIRRLKSHNLSSESHLKFSL